MISYVALLPLALLASESVLAAPSPLQPRASKAVESKAPKAPKAPKESAAPKAAKGPAASAPAGAAPSTVPTSEPAAPPASGGGGSSSGSSGSAIGYASMNGGTTGGGSAAATVVTTLAALRTACAGTTARVVTINGIIKGDGAVVDVGSNISIKGGSGGGLTGSGFRIKGQKNVIIQNLKISLTKAPVDLIAVDSSTNVWIDHNELSNDLKSGKDFYDGACDITHASDFITVSWNHFHDTFKTSLVGHSDGNKAEDTGKLKVTYHHNFFSNVGSRLPSLRFGTGHVFNNYFKDVATSGAHARLGAQMLIENNVFENVKQPIMLKADGGFAVQKGNTFVGSDAPDDAPGTLSTVPYKYTLDAVTGVAAAVSGGAGAK